MGRIDANTNAALLCQKRMSEDMSSKSESRRAELWIGNRHPEANVAWLDHWKI
jgi:hypothetical protein